ncbi:preprotein translocase subunit YajC [Blochmannia endosymbiont of Polyrhachis (Hedomyrma) turneri]|uniref:preprotein translocase subunit YajC n=1 Tax=Blochmannia endosymbiont of Polyrhachis (Hedomyrma) turneri TaxID=1505596 RepID=UPI00061A796E|nr:preprotein translocase subunit YajC [Blochmannia endosymbiont of Polyrhachis (Hedomyrma) turneri]AKC59805.1 UPF0092 membrane protein yajC [Blochmannia endosymbiont of Polyrhachis (Hedomyrma) turneri]
MNIFIFDAIADTGISSQSNPYSIIIMLVIFAAIFYFLIFRPQQKRNRVHKELMNAISKDDEIATVGGLIGRVTKVTETGYVFVSLNEINEVIVKRDCITAILPKGTIQAL